MPPATTSPVTRASAAGKRKRGVAATAAADTAATASPDKSRRDSITNRSEIDNDNVSSRSLSPHTQPTPASGAGPCARKDASLSADEGLAAATKRQKTEDDLAADPEQNQHALTSELVPPPRAGLVDPVGYRTNPPPTGRPVRIYADGVFDLFHLGHMRQLEQAKTAFPDVYLLVGVTGDEETHKRKGLTVLNGEERAETVRHCKWVDEVVPDCPWIVTPEFLYEHRIDFVAHDDIPYGADEGDDIYAPIKAQGKFLVTQRTEGVSTTSIITNIIRDYEKYIARQLSRGTSRQELNVSWLKKNELEIKRHVAGLRNTIRNNWTVTGQELGRELRQLWQNSRPNSPARASSFDLGLGRITSRRSEANANGNANSTDADSPRSPGAQSADGGGGGPASNSGLIGGVKAWMSRNGSLRDSRQPSPESEDDKKDRTASVNSVGVRS